MSNRNSDMVLASSYREENQTIAVNINDTEEIFNSNNCGLKICSQIEVSELLTEYNINCKQVWIQALNTNTGAIYFCTEEFNNTDMPGLYAKDSIIINVKNPNNIYILSEIIGEGCKWRVIE